MRRSTGTNWKIPEYLSIIFHLRSYICSIDWINSVTLLIQTPITHHSWKEEEGLFTTGFQKNMSSTEWTYHMTISNQTGETLVAHNEERNWGIWYLGGKDKSAPCLHQCRRNQRSIWNPGIQRYRHRLSGPVYLDWGEWFPDSFHRSSILKRQ